MELVNWEINFNKIFNISFIVGVINLLVKVCVIDIEVGLYLNLEGDGFVWNR